MSRFLSLPRTFRGAAIVLVALIAGLASAQSADLRIVKESGADGTVLAGEQFRYYIIVDNFGPDTATNVEIRDTLMTEYEQAVDANGCSISVRDPGGAITVFDCNFALSSGVFDLGLFGANDLEPKSPTGDIGTDVGRVIVTIDLTATEPVDLTNVATVVSDTNDPNYENNTATDYLSVTASSDLDVSAALLSGATMTAGEDATLRLTVTNEGPSTSLGSFVEIALPPEFGSVTFAVTHNDGSVADGACTVGVAGDPANPAVCDLGVISPQDDGATPFDDRVRRVDLTTSVPASWDADSQVQIDLSAATDSTDTVSTNDAVSLSADVDTSANLFVTHEAPASITAGGIGTLTATVGTSGPSYARDVLLTETLPAGLSAVAASVVDLSASVCVISTDGHPNDTVTCDLGDLEPGSAGSRIAKIDVAVQDDVVGGSSLTATATVESLGTSDPDTSDNQATAAASIDAAPTASLAVIPGAATPTDEATPAAGSEDVPVVQAVLDVPSTSDDVLVSALGLGVSESTTIVTQGLDTQAIDFSNVETVELYLDPNANGAVDEGETLLGTAASIDVVNGAIHLPLDAPLEVEAGTTATVLVVFDIAADTASTVSLAVAMLALAPLGLWLRRRKRYRLLLATALAALAVSLAACTNTTSGAVTTKTVTLESRLTSVDAHPETVSSGVEVSGIPLQGATLMLSSTSVGSLQDGSAD